MEEAKLFRLDAIERKREAKAEAIFADTTAALVNARELVWKILRRLNEVLAQWELHWYWHGEETAHGTHSERSHARGAVDAPTFGELTQGASERHP